MPMIVNVLDQLFQGRLQRVDPVQQGKDAGRGCSGYELSGRLLPVTFWKRIVIRVHITDLSDYVVGGLPRIALISDRSADCLVITIVVPVRTPPLSRRSLLSKP